VYEDVGAAEAVADRVCQLVRGRVRRLERRAVLELQVHIDVAARTGLARAQLAEGDDAALGAELADRRADPFELFFRQRLVDQRAGRAPKDPHARDRDAEGNQQRHRGVDPLLPRHGHEHEADQHRGGGGDVGAEVQSVGLERDRPGLAGARADVRPRG
jgi:hypothetical protein